MDLKPIALAVLVGSLITACGGSSSPSPTTPVTDGGDTGGTDGGTDGGTTIEAPSTYSFNSQFTGFEDASSVSYTGQLARHMLIEEIVTLSKSFTEDQIGTTPQEIIESFELYFDNEGEIANSQAISFARTGVDFLPQTDGVTTIGNISTGKNLVGKIAGNDTGVNSGNLQSGLVNGEFYGWTETAVPAFTATGAAGARPEDFARHLFELLAIEVTDGVVPQISTSTGNVSLDVAYVDDKGRDFNQLIQKFLLGAITFSQGAADYLQTDFSAKNEQDGSKPYTGAEHFWDEGFGYFGAARDYNDYTDDEIAAKGGRTTHSSGYFDSNADGFIDLRSEINLANSTNCAKRDRGTAANTNPTDFTKTVFDAFIAGRTVLAEAAAASALAGTRVDLTETQLSAVRTAADTAAGTWEKCIAATVVHYINDLSADINNYADGSYSDLNHYKNMAKHWSEMKGFALGLQFYGNSPIYSSTDNAQAFRTALDAMGTGPVLADAGDTAIADYLAALSDARTTLQNIYQFDSENVANW